MKTTILKIAFLLLVFYSCSKEEPQIKEPEQRIKVEEKFNYKFTSTSVVYRNEIKLLTSYGYWDEYNITKVQADSIKALNTSTEINGNKKTVKTCHYSKIY